VVPNSTLKGVGQSYANLMNQKQTMSHYLDRNLGERMTAKGLYWHGWGENIAQGYSSAAGVMNGWMNSPGHRENILNCKFTTLGVGYVVGTDGPWWVQEFMYN
jgi:uncharacterized protein YkwD